MSKKNKQRKAERKAAKRAYYRNNPFFTPRLNAALERIAHDPGRDAKHRVWAWMVRHSWGNWSPYAVTKEPRLPAAQDFDVRAEIGISIFSEHPEVIGMLGTGPCPMCGEVREPHEALPPDWRWHLECLELAYSADACVCGNDAEYDWARSVAWNPERNARRLWELPQKGKIQ